MPMNEIAFERARHSLEGLSIGDAFGGYFFGRVGDESRRITERMLPVAPWNCSDDTMMALSIVSILRQYGEVDQDRLAQSFAERYEQSRGYGPAMRRLLLRIREGEQWQEAANKLFAGQGSFGNGGAMRVAPLGAYFADDIGMAAEQAKRSAEITHSHSEGIAGAIAIAVAAAIAWQSKNEGARPTTQEFLDQILSHVPESVVREKIRHARNLDPNASVRLAASALGSGHGLAAQDTVAYTLWCAGQHLDNYEEALWLTVSGGGDVDTTSAIVGGIVAAYTGTEGIPSEWRTRRELLPNWPFFDAYQGE